VKTVLLAITKARAGCASVVDGRGRLTGIFTDGDLRRHLKGPGDLAQRKVVEIMTRRPKVIGPDRLAAEALRILREFRIDELVVVDAQHRPIGLLDVQDLLKIGFV
jgi:arabinose-5-phosphate isomerase